MIGEIKQFAGNSSALSSYYLPCDGRALSRITYSDLFAVIGTLWGSGDGSTTFNIPDLRDKFVRGSGVSRSVGSFQTEQNAAHTHTLTVNSGGVHSHQFNQHTSNTSYSSQSETTFVAYTTVQRAITGVESYFDGGNHSHTADCANSGGSELRPANIAVLYCIQVFNESSLASSGLTEEQANMLQTVYDFITANCKQNQDGSYDFTKIFPVPAQGSGEYYLSDHFNYLVCKLNGEY